MTTMGSSAPTLDPRRKEWTEEEGRRGSPSIHLSIYLSVHVGS